MIRAIFYFVRAMFVLGVAVYVTKQLSEDVLIPLMVAVCVILADGISEIILILDKRS